MCNIGLAMTSLSIQSSSANDIFVHIRQMAALLRVYYRVCQNFRANFDGLLHY